MKGFSIVELLVVVIILGILAAIASPIVLGQVNKAKTTEAYSTLREANSAQLLYLLTHDTFAPDAETLRAGILLETANYTYTDQRAHLNRKLRF